MRVLDPRLFAEGDAQELAEPLGDVVGEPVAVEHGDDVIVVGEEGEVASG